MSGYGELSASFDKSIKSMESIHSQLRSIMEMAQQWREDMTEEEYHALVAREDEMANNARSLMDDYRQMEDRLKEHDLSVLPDKRLALRDKYKADLRQLLQNLMRLQEKQEEMMRLKSDQIRQSLDETRQGLVMIKNYQTTDQAKGSRIDLAG